jgi:hypothetical protein
VLAPDPAVVLPIADGTGAASTLLPPTTLARGRALIEDSAAARATVAAMLSAMPGPDIGQP